MMNNKRTRWGDTERAELTRLWDEKELSARQIQLHLVEELKMEGLTRSAVIGMARRLNLSPRQKSASTVRNERVLVQRRVHAPGSRFKSQSLPCVATLFPSPTPRKKHGVTLVQLANDGCRWPLSGDRTNMLFCGCAQENGSSYCSKHYRESLHR
jgi:hypothetical protein